MKSADDILASIKRFRIANLKITTNQRQIAKTSESGHLIGLRLMGRAIIPGAVSQFQEELCRQQPARDDFFAKACVSRSRLSARFVTA
jgi:hypothetical protein